MNYKKRKLTLFLFFLVWQTVITNGQRAVTLEITGKVISAAGNPLSGVDVLANKPGIMGKTGADGQYVLQVFEGSNITNLTCCTVSFHLNGYQRVTRAVDLGSHQLDIVLPLENKWAPERCTPSMALHRVGWSMKLLAPKEAIIEENYYGNGHHAFKIGFGPEGNRDWITLFFAPLNVGISIDKQHLISSINFRERDMLSLDGIDYRGQYSNGKKWRKTGFSNESITYENVSDKTADYFDAIIDSMCIDPKRAMPLGSLDNYKKP
jgi:hypothetical protein